jgi:hypothetical protein
MPAAAALQIASKLHSKAKIAAHRLRVQSALGRAPEFSPLTFGAESLESPSMAAVGVAGGAVRVYGTESLAVPGSAGGGRGSGASSSSTSPRVSFAEGSAPPRGASPSLHEPSSPSRYTFGDQLDEGDEDDADDPTAAAYHNEPTEF